MPRSRPGRKEMAAKSASATHQRIHPPPDATIPVSEDRGLNEAQQTARVEMLMLKGVRNPDIIATMLDLPARTIQRHQERVKARWEITGGGRDITTYRGEALARLDLVESEAWSKFGALDNKKDPSAKDQAMFLKLITDIQQQRSDLLGLSPKVIERIALMPDRQNEVVSRLAAQRGLSQMAIRLTQLLAERRAAIGLPAARYNTPEEIEGTATAIEDAEA